MLRSRLRTAQRRQKQSSQRSVEVTVSDRDEIQSERRDCRREELAQNREMVVPLPARQDDPDQAVLERSRLLRHHVQPPQIVLQMPPRVGDVESLSERALERRRRPGGLEDSGVLLPDLGLHEAVDVLGVDPDHRLDQRAQAELLDALLAEVPQHVVPDDYPQVRPLLADETRHVPDVSQEEVLVQLQAADFALAHLEHLVAADVDVLEVRVQGDHLEIDEESVMWNPRLVVAYLSDQFGDEIERGVPAGADGLRASGDLADFYPLLVLEREFQVTEGLDEGNDFQLGGFRELLDFRDLLGGVRVSGGEILQDALKWEHVFVF